MKISVAELPSKGYNYLVRDIDLNPLTYSQLMKYGSKNSLNKLDKILWDIDCLLGDIPGYQDFCSYDMKTLIFTRKYISATFNDFFKFKLDAGEIVTVKVSDITYKSIPIELKQIDTVKFGGYEFQFTLPTIGKYSSVARILASSHPEVDPEVAMVIASLCDLKNIDHVTKCILSATGNDILLIEYLSTILNDVTNDITVRLKGGETVISLNDSITDIFQFIKLNSRFDKGTSITTKAL